MLKKVGVCGHFGGNKLFLDGQTVKTKIIFEKLQEIYGSNQIMKIDTYGGVKRIFSQIIQLVVMIFKCENIIMMPAHNSLRVFFPILYILNVFLKRKLHYVVIGGWLPEFLYQHNWLKKILNKFDYIYVETESMLVKLNELNLNNVCKMENCKKLQIISQDKIVEFKHAPYKVCTFSRVMKEKGIEEAIQAVEYINEKYKKRVFELDIYGQIDENYMVRFKSVMEQTKGAVQYKGVVSFEESSRVLKSYYALLFPTYYSGEGFAGTLIDAMAAGVPVIASNWRYNAEIVKENVTGVIYDIDREHDLIKKMEYIAQNNQVWNKMKVLCLEEAENYTPDIVLQKLIKNIEE